MASANLFQQYLQPVRSVADYSADMDKAESNKLALVGQRRQNELAALTADQTRQTMADGAADRNALQRLASTWSANTSLDDRVAALRNSGRPALMSQADALEKQGLEKTKTGAAAAKDQAEADAKTAEIKWKLADRHAQQLSFVKTPQDAVAYIDEGIREGSFPAEGRDRALALVQQMGVDQWKAAAAQAAVPVLERYKQEADTLRTKMGNDTSIKTTQMNNATSRANNSASIAAENERAKAGRQQAATADDQRVTYQQDANGNLVALPVKISGVAGSVSPVPVVAGSKPMQGKGSPQATFDKQYGIVKNALSDVRDLLPKATHSGLGSAVDSTANFFGQSTEGADAAAKLDTIGGWLTSTAPRFEGPQSDKDVAQYKMMAGNVANRNLPVSQRLQAVDALEKLMYGRAKAYGIKTDSAAPTNAVQTSDPIAAELARRGHK